MDVDEVELLLNSIEFDTARQHEGSRGLIENGDQPRLDELLAELDSVVIRPSCHWQKDAES